MLTAGSTGRFSAHDWCCGVVVGGFEVWGCIAEDFAGVQCRRRVAVFMWFRGLELLVNVKILPRAAKVHVVGELLSISLCFPVADEWSPAVSCIVIRSARSRRSGLVAKNLQ